VHGQYGLAGLYENGHGVPQDYAQAAPWYRKAAEQGVGLAQYALGSEYENGHGVPLDHSQAYFWLDLATAGDLGAMAKLAIEDRDKAASFLTPAELSRAQERARKWFEEHPTQTQ
jgi:TPR repeat protein